ncbi:MAG: hypothetical protein WD205_00310, partial [Rhodothermales bacterium]
GMGTTRTGPIAIRNARGTFPEDDLWNTATAFHFEAVYNSGVTMVVSSEERMGVRFEGDDGWIWVTRGGYEVSDPAIWETVLSDNDIRLYSSDDHRSDFLESVLAGTDPIAPIEEAHRSISIAHLGNIAMRLGRDLRWDPEREVVLDDTTANDMLGRPMRGDWSL